MGERETIAGAASEGESLANGVNQWFSVIEMPKKRKKQRGGETERVEHNSDANQGRDVSASDRAERVANTARIYFQKARDEAIARLGHRERGLFLFVTFLAALLGVIISNPKYYPALLVVPFLSWGVASILLQHDIIIGSLARYVGIELEHELADAGANPIQWELSDSLLSRNPKVLKMRAGGHFGLRFVPSAISLIVTLALFIPSAVSLVCHSDDNVRQCERGRSKRQRGWRRRHVWRRREER